MKKSMAYAAMALVIVFVIVNACRHEIPVINGGTAETAAVELHCLHQTVARILSIL